MRSPTLYQICLCKSNQRIVKMMTMGMLLLLIGVSGCSQRAIKTSSENNKPKVVATSTIIADLTEKIADDEIELKSLLKPGADPHIYEPVPSDSLALEKAQLILYNGYDLEPGIIRLMEASVLKGKKVAVGEVVKPLKLEKKGAKVPDPHVWGDVKNVIEMVKVIKEELIKVSPEDKDKFNQNAEKLIKELTELDQWISKEMLTIPPEKRKLVTTHDAFQYYAKAYKIEIIGTLIGISTEEQPSAQTVKKLAENIKKSGVKAIFAETTINPALIRTLAQESGVKLAEKELYSDSIGAKGSEGDSYVKMMKSNTKTIVGELGGK